MNKENIQQKLERDKGYDKTFTWRTVSCSENRRQEKENEMALEISRHDGWLRHLAKFNFACALTFLVKSIVKVSRHQNELKHANSILLSIL